MLKKRDTTETIYDPNVQHHFEDWLMEAGVKIRFNTATYFIEIKKMNKMYTLLKKMGLISKDQINTLHIVTNRPGYLIGKAGIIINKYTEILRCFGIDRIRIHEIRDQDVLLRGIKRKIAIREIAEHDEYLQSLSEKD